jgi:hypothetical protein
VCSEPSAMRLGTSADSSTIELTEEGGLVAVRPLSPSGKRPVDRARPSGRPLEEWTLLEELWRISHFGWIPEAVIWRALTLAGDREIPTDSLHQGLRQLLDRGWVQHDASEDTDGERRWRLTDNGRDIRVS